MVHYFKHRTRCAGLGVSCSIHKPRYAGVNDRSSAHGAGFERSVEFATGEAVVIQALGGGAERDDFGMSGGVKATQDAVLRARDNFSVIDDDGTDGNFSGFGSEACLLNRELKI